MAGIVPNEGENLIANLVFKNADVNRGSSLELILFTNSTISETTTAASLTQPTGTGYAAITLNDASWSVSGDEASYALQTFTGGSGGWTGSIYGYAVITTGTAARILALEIDPSGPYTISENDTYDVTPVVTVA